MSEEQLKAFLEKVKADTSLQEKLKAAADSDAVLAIAKDAGFSISTDDLTKAQSIISDQELESAASESAAALSFSCMLVSALTFSRNALSCSSDMGHRGSLHCQ